MPCLTLCMIILEVDTKHLNLKADAEVVGSRDGLWMLTPLPFSVNTVCLSALRMSTLCSK